MRWRVLAALVLVSIPSIPATSANDVVLSEILISPNSGPEFVEIWNRGASAVDLAGWKVGDLLTTASNYTFASRTLPAGARIVVWTGSGAVDTPEGLKWTGSTKWNDAGDTARLFDAGGQLVDSLAYKSNPAQGAPERKAPAKGMALALVDGAWIEDEPTPGHASGSQIVPVEGTVPALPPQAHLTGPDRVRAGRLLALQVDVTDSNGDLASWDLSSGSSRIATGTAAPPSQVNVTAPTRAGPWWLTLTATDETGLRAVANWTVNVVANELEVSLPEGAPNFGVLVPGARNVTAAQPILLRNAGNTTMSVRLDVSDLRNGTSVIQVAGNLEIVASHGAVLYDGPLTQVATLAPGEQVSVTLRLRDVPMPAAPGKYGTSLAVVTA